VPFGRVRLDPQDANALLIEADEALDPASAENAALYDYDGGNLAVSAQLVEPRTVRATFAVVPTIGQTIDLVATDMAGNLALLFAIAVTAADTQPPLVVPPAGVSVPSLGGDTVTVAFSELLDPGMAVDAGNYSLQNGAGLLDLSGASLVYDSTTQAVTIHLPPGQDLDVNAAVTLTVSALADASGNALPAPVAVGGAVTGDTTPPDIDSAFVNWHRDAGGLIVDVLFSEDVETAFVEDELNWIASSGQGVLDVTLLNPDFARVQLAAPLAAAGRHARPAPRPDGRRPQRQPGAGRRDARAVTEKASARRRRVPAAEPSRESGTALRARTPRAPRGRLPFRKRATAIDTRAGFDPAEPSMPPETAPTGRPW
jgi:hypothetical protein